MAISPAAVASPRQFYQGQPGIGATTLYTAPALNTSVTAPSATAYITEIVICNTTASPANITVFVGGSTPSNALIYSLTINGYDSKVLSGLKTFIPAGHSISALQGTNSALTLTISGVEVQ